MKTRLSGSLMLAIVLFMAVSYLYAQAGGGGGGGARDYNSNSGQLIQNLVDQISSAEPYFKQAYQLLDIQLPASITRNPTLFQEAEKRFFQYNYIVGIINARSEFIYNTKQTLKKMKADYIRSNPMPHVADTHSTMNSQDIIRSSQIRNQINAYDDAISCTNDMYNMYQRRIGALVKTAKQLSGYVIYYKAYVENNSNQYMETQYLSRITDAMNRGKRDAGGMSDNEYKMRSFALNILIPMFDSAKRTDTADGLSGAIEKIFGILPMPK